MRDKDNELVVIKANAMIQDYKYTLSKTEMRVVNTIISNIKSPKYDEELNVMEFDILEFCRMLGWEDVGGDNYKLLRRTLWNLSNKSSDYIDFGNYETIVRWIERPIFEKGTGVVKLKLDDYLKPFLLQASGTINAKLKYYFEMDSKYSMRLYELLKSYDGYSFAKFEIEELKIHMDALKKSYSNFAMFKRTVLDPAVEEINAVTDLTVSYTTQNRGRKVTHVDFAIKKKTRSDLMKKDVLPVQDAVLVENSPAKPPVEPEQIPGQMGIEDFINPVAGNEGLDPTDQKKADFARPFFEITAKKYPISDEQLCDIYNMVFKRMGDVLFTRKSEHYPEIMRMAMQNLAQKASGRTIKSTLHLYLKGIVDKDHEFWQQQIQLVKDADEREAKRIAAQRSAAAAEAKAEAEMDAKVAAWKKSKQEE